MIDTIKNMNFSEIVGLLNEPNRPSGGSKTISEIIHNSFIGFKENASILEVGSNTGFSSIEFGTYLPNTQVIGIDINKNSIERATEKKEKFNLHNVSFKEANGKKIPFKNESFDLVFPSNATSFMKDKESAVKEYYRVLKKNGILAVAPIFYTKTPPNSLLKKVEKAIGVKIDKKNRGDWISLFEVEGSNIIYNKLHKYEYISYEKIQEYTHNVIENAHLSGIYAQEEIELLKEKLLDYYILFNENLQYCCFEVILFMKNYPNNEPELYFTS